MLIDLEKGGKCTPLVVRKTLAFNKTRENTWSSFSSNSNVEYKWSDRMKSMMNPVTISLLGRLE